MTNPIAITAEQIEAYDLLENSRQNLFITGKAGTGKSTFLQYFRQHTTKNIAVLAPTGVAALNVRGQTIHSFFLLKPGFINVMELKPSRRRIFRQLELLIIDEISMVRADVFDAIDHTLRFARKNNQPFGGVQVCVIGDLLQLPPVVTREEQELYSQYYPSPFFFATKAYEAGQFRMVQFETIHRQQDKGFINLLNAIRTGTADYDTLDALNARYIPKAVPSPGTLVLTTTNRIADELNDTKLASIPAAPRVYAGKLEGNFGVSGVRLPAPEELVLKPGAQVIFVKNDSDGKWVNGTIGTVESLGDKLITVRVGENLLEVEPVTWQAVTYDIDSEEDKVVETVQGSYKQFPLMLAWGITIHKAQGKTLERVIINLGSGAFAAGQLYVALSRCKSLEGIALKTRVTPADIRCDEEVLAFMESQHCSVGV